MDCPRGSRMSDRVAGTLGCRQTSPGERETLHPAGYGPTRPFWQQTRPQVPALRSHEMWRLRRQLHKNQCQPFWVCGSSQQGDMSQPSQHPPGRARVSAARRTQEPADGCRVVAEFSKEFTRELNRLRNEQTANGETAKTEAARVSRQIEKLVMAIADGADAPALNDKIKELEARRDALKAELASMSDEPVTLIHPSLPALYRRKVAQLADLLDDPTTKDEAFEAIRSLIEEVRLIPQDGPVDDRDQGRAGRYSCLYVRQAEKNRALGARPMPQSKIKAVAGVGFEPTTFRL